MCDAQVKDEAFHKMTLMKAEYTGRVKRREDKISELEGKLARLTGADPAPALALSAGGDKENDASMLSNGNQNANSKSKSNGPSKGGKASKSSAQAVEEDSGEAISATKRSTRSSAKALAPV